MMHRQVHSIARGDLRRTSVRNREKDSRCDSEEISATVKRFDFLAGGLASALAGCAPTGPVAPHSVLDDAMEPLRSRFNASRRKVRAVMLLSPT
jgi:hypothetical protein